MTNLIIFDWNRTIFDPEKKLMYPEASILLKALQKNILILISRAEGSDPSTFLKQANLLNFFTEIITTSKKTPELFRNIKIKYPADSYWVIGDKLDSEIMCGNQAGFTTVRVRQGKFASLLPQSTDEQPCFEIDSLLEFFNILSS